MFNQVNLSLLNGYSNDYFSIQIYRMWNVIELFSLDVRYKIFNLFECKEMLLFQYKMGTIYSFENQLNLFLKKKNCDGVF